MASGGARRTGRWWRRGACVVAALVAVAACSSDDDRAVTTLDLTTTEPVITTEATTTTTQPSTTTTVDPRLAEVRSLVARTSSGLVAILTEDRDPETASQFLTGRQLDSFVDSVRKARAEGLRSEGEFVGEVRHVELVEDERAVVIECGRDAVRTLDPSGSVVFASDEQSYLREYEVVLTEGSWRVELITFGAEKTPCDI